MPITVVVGAQFGGEGKGKIVSHLSTTDDVDFVVRCGGPNSGHTVDYSGFRIGLRMLPAGFVNEATKLRIAAGALVNVRILLDELQRCHVESSRLKIDRNACIVADDFASQELARGLRKRVGSTASGTGIAVAKRALRDDDVKLAKDVEVLAPFIENVSTELNDAIDRGKKIVIEGTQGFGLSLYHTDNYPYSTSRDTTASGFLSETGLAPALVDDVIMAVRTFPIRVEGESGPLRDEITWETLEKMSGYQHHISENTTATARTRRVGMFDIQLVRSAARVNRPTKIALHGADYLDYRNKGITVYDSLSERAVQFIETLEDSLKVPVAFIGTGQKNEEIIDRRKSDLVWQPHQVQATLKA